MNIQKEVEALIAAEKALLGEAYQQDLDALFYNLSYKGSPELDEKPFYFYSYELYSSLAEIPENKTLGVVYLYVQDGALHYQLLSKKNPATLYSGTLNTGGMDLNLLKECHFVALPPTAGGNSREIFYQLDVDRSKLVYIVSDDAKNIRVGFLIVSPEDTSEIIEQKLLAEVTEKSFCSKKEKYLKTIEDSITSQLIKEEHFEPSYEKPFSSEDPKALTVESVYKELLEQEQKMLLFFEEMSAILANADFKKTFSGNHKSLQLILAMEKDIRILIDCQRRLIDNLSGANNTNEVIDKIKAAYGADFLTDTYSKLMSHIVMLDKITKHERHKKTVSSFANKSVKAKIDSEMYKTRSGEYKTIMESLERSDTPEYFLERNIMTARFAQLLLRRKMPLTDNLPKLFREGYARFDELKTAFLAVNRLAAAANRAEIGYLENLRSVDKNYTAKEKIQEKLATNGNPVQAMSFDLLLPIFDIYYSDTRPFSCSSNDLKNINIDQAFLSCKTRLKIAIDRIMGYFKGTDLILMQNIPSESDFMIGQIYLKKLAHGKVKYAFKTPDGAIIMKVLNEASVSNDIAITDQERIKILEEIRAQNEDCRTGIVIHERKSIVEKITSLSDAVASAKTIQDLPIIIEAVTRLSITIQEELYPNQKKEELPSQKEKEIVIEVKLPQDEQRSSGIERAPSPDDSSLTEEQKSSSEGKEGSSSQSEQELSETEQTPSQDEPSITEEQKSSSEGKEDLSPESKQRFFVAKRPSSPDEPSLSSQDNEPSKRGSSTSKSSSEAEASSGKEEISDTEQPPSPQQDRQPESAQHSNGPFKTSTLTADEIVQKHGSMLLEGFFSSQINLPVVIALCEIGDATAIFALAKAAYNGKQGIIEDHTSAYYLASLAEEIAQTEDSKKSISNFIKKINVTPVKCKPTFPSINGQTPLELYMNYMEITLKATIELCEKGDATALFVLAQAAYNGKQGVIQDHTSAYYLASLAERIEQTEESKKSIASFIKKISKPPAECDPKFPRINGYTPQELFMNYMQVDLNRIKTSVRFSTTMTLG